MGRITYVAFMLDEWEVHSYVIILSFLARWIQIASVNKEIC